MQKLLISTLFCATLLMGCSAHKLEIQQGNIIDPEAVSQLQPGMTKKQVLFIMGTPLLTDPFHQNRWDYIYLLSKSDHSRKEERLTLFFDGDTLSRIEPVNIELADK